MEKGRNIPVIKIDPEALLKSDIDLLLKSKFDIFYRRIVEYTMSIVEGGR